MALNYTSDILSLYATDIATDANYQSPGNFDLPAAISGETGVTSVTIGTAGSYAYNAQPTATASAGTATFSVNMDVVTVSAVVAPGTLKVPGDVLVVAGGTTTHPATLTITHTQVVGVTIVGVGSGGTPGAATLTGLSGTGTKFQATVVIQGDGTLTGAPAPVITVAGNYTANPTLSGEMVSATASLTGVTVNLVMGVLTTTISDAGVYSVTPSATPIHANKSTPVGTDATFTLLFGVNSLDVLTPGFYDEVAPTIAFSGGSAAATANLGATTYQTDTQKLFTLVEVVRSLIAEANGPAQLKDIHEVLRKMLAAMRFGGPTSFSAANLAASALDAAMNYIAKNPTHGGANI